MVGRGGPAGVSELRSTDITVGLTTELLKVTVYGPASGLPATSVTVTLPGPTLLSAANADWISPATVEPLPLTRLMLPVFRPLNDRRNVPPVALPSVMLWVGASTVRSIGMPMLLMLTVSEVPDSKLLASAI